MNNISRTFNYYFSLICGDEKTIICSNCNCRKIIWLSLIRSPINRVGFNLLFFLVYWKQMIIHIFGFDISAYMQVCFRTAGFHYHKGDRQVCVEKLLSKPSSKCSKMLFEP